MSNTSKNPEAVPPEAAAKPSNADYPVEKADLVSQQQRLRKAAAAGVDALKSPISSLISSLSSSPPAMPPKPLEPQAALTNSSPTTEVLPKPSQVPLPTPHGEEQAFLERCKLTERESSDQFGRTILLLTSGAFAVSFIFLKDVIKPANTTNKGCLVAAWVLWCAAMLCTLLSFYASHLSARHAQKLFRRGLRGQELDDSRVMNKVTLSLNPLAGVWFMVGLVLMTVFVATNLTHESSGSNSTGPTNAITAALSTNGTAFPTGATNATIPSTAEQITNP